MRLNVRTGSYSRSTNGANPAAVIISAGGSPGALDIVRCLRMAGIPSCVMSSQRRDIAFASRGCLRRVQLPVFEAANYAEIVAVLLDYGRGCAEKPVLFYASDPELKFVWTYRDELAPVFRFLLPPPGLFESLMNKVLFGKYAAENGLPVPAAVRCHDAEEVEARMLEIPFPCIVKPAFSEHWNWKTDELWEKFGPYKSALRKFSYPRDLMEFCRDLPRRNDGFIIQQYIEGRDETIYSFHGYFDEGSNCLGSFVGCKIRTYPMHTGGSAYIRTLHHDELSELSIRILRQMNFRGIVKIDFKQDPRTGKFYILEANSRYNLWQLLGAYAGTNLAAVAYHHQRGDLHGRAIEYAEDYKLLYLKQDLRSFFKGYWRSGEWTVMSYLRSLRGKKCFRVWDRTDPVPFLVSTMAFGLRNAGRLFRWIFTRPAPDALPALDTLGHKKKQEELRTIGLAHTTRVKP